MTIDQLHNLYRERLFDVLNTRLLAAREAGWTFEDSRVTPGIPVIGVRRPNGAVAGLVPSLGRARIRYMHAAWEELDTLGVP